MQQHFREVKMFITLGKESDSHGKHFLSQFPNSTPFPHAKCEGIACSIIWQDKPHQCGLNICNNKLHVAHKRRNCNSKTTNLQILSMTRIDSHHRKNTRFHWHAKWTTATDESSNKKRRQPSTRSCHIDVSTGATFVQLMSNWKHCNEQQKRKCFTFSFKQQP